MKNIFYITFSFLFLFTSCRKDEFDTDITVIPTGEETTTKLVGFVTDEDGGYIISAQVNAGNMTTTTDENGFFIFENINIPENGFAVTVNHETRYMENIIRVVPNKEDITYTEVVLYEPDVRLTFDNNEGATLRVEEELSIQISPNTLELGNGSDYNGAVEAELKWMPADDDNTLAIMPGNLEGLDFEGENVILGTYGMFSVEFTTDNGQSLNLKEGSTAEVFVQIPSSMIRAAPSDLPVWSLNESAGIWVEETSANLDGNRYSFEVDHFSFWNCDAPFPVVQISGTVSDENGFVLPNAFIRISFTNGNVFFTRFGYTNQEGFFTGKVPKDQVLDVEIRDIVCGENTNTEIQIGPFSEDQNDVNVVALFSTVLYDVSGIALDCDLNPIENALIIADDNDGRRPRTVLSDENGFFELSSLCSDLSYNVRIVDRENQKEMAGITISLEQNDIGTVVVCDEVTEFVNIQSDFADMTFFNPSVFFLNSHPDSLYFTIYEENEEGFFQINSSHVETGIANPMSFDFTDYDTSISCGNNSMVSICDQIEHNIITINEVQKMVIGSLSGTVLDESPNPVEHPVTVNYRVFYD